MRIKFLNTEYFIGSCNNEDIPDSITKIGPAQDVVFSIATKEIGSC